jgi:hypothetical protein
MSLRTATAGLLAVSPPAFNVVLAGCAAFLATALPAIDPTVIGDPADLALGGATLGAAVGGLGALGVASMAWLLVRRAPTRARWRTAALSVAACGALTPIGTATGVALALGLVVPGGMGTTVPLGVMWPPVAAAALPAGAMLLLGQRA